MVVFRINTGKAEPLVGGPHILGVIVIDEVEIGDPVSEEDFFKPKPSTPAPSASARAGQSRNDLI